MSNRPAPRLVEVHSSQRLTPNMQRLVLTGPALLGFPEGQEGANLKLLLPRPGEAVPDLDSFPQGPNRPVVRTYTVRHYHKASNQLTIDFALHGEHGGPASRFALTAKPGDKVGIAGPGPLKLTDLDAEHFLFAADMSALPAAAGILESLPATAKGHAVFEITSPEDRYPIAAPAGIHIHWLCHPEPQQPSLGQLEAIRALPWPQGSLSIFVAGEGSAVRAIRRFLLDERDIARKAMYASPYWKIGLTEDQHQVQKKTESD
ncbi:siderophore-interacting protein [Gallaecimonas xiamenensis]|uniref:FAD-binding 9, siderophore-interacting domain-containing protein n=1 Tax=Gallaecimonas xiamenensis 3-C-1 TaxID=745411 RepID=K2K4K4_9GAMM|nr:siderophore-interacting protein [Gallaecimonas xiamenensis]EKE77869.1 FAD-binding 9, siderophore-interacting domain-containing protein [Gallaecimonas xiamenensis 3-C-1]